MWVYFFGLTKMAVVGNQPSSTFQGWNFGPRKDFELVNSFGSKVFVAENSSAMFKQPEVAEPYKFGGYDE